MAKHHPNILYIIGQYTKLICPTCYNKGRHTGEFKFDDWNTLGFSCCTRWEFKENFGTDENFYCEYELSDYCSNKVSKLELERSKALSKCSHCGKHVEDLTVNDLCYECSDSNMDYLMYATNRIFNRLS